MSRTVTVILFVSIAGILVWVLMRERKATAATGTNVTIDLGKAISSIGGFFTKSGDKAAPAGYVTTTDTQGQAAYALSHGVVEQQGNQLIDLNTGNALVFGPN